MSKRLFRLQSLFYFYFFVRFDHIAYLDIVAVRQADTTLEVGTYFLHIVLETFQSIDRTGKDYDTVADQTGLVAAFQEEKDVDIQRPEQRILIG